ncbi:DUF397 domain-containing protein [Nocardia vermiculata]|uniref:DUF397 domain-containing protein n=1 Tax=Nocardia vermiculata TaxID=257274 RepID=A0A846Y426_9NOCA|nr:DUF397 domain-containing protein [Nocardia vermiculata]NKY51409.1 DUF397 domain-containing protein [Nocardia vermiculata]
MTGNNEIDLSTAKWFTSTRTSGGKDCVEVAFLPGGHVGVRDSKDRTGPALVFAPGEWDSFTSVISKSGFPPPA